MFEQEALKAKAFIKLFLRGNYEDARRMASGGVQPNLNLSLIKGIRVGLPPLAEQGRIVAEAERLLSLAEEAERVIVMNLKRAMRLRQAILKRAFEGKLVPQDPSDEPASVLLERIRVERGRLDHDPAGRDLGAKGAKTAKRRGGRGVAAGQGRLPGV